MKFTLVFLSALMVLVSVVIGQDIPENGNGVNSKFFFGPGRYRPGYYHHGYGRPHGYPHWGRYPGYPYYGGYTSGGFFGGFGFRNSDGSEPIQPDVPYDQDQFVA